MPGGWYLRGDVGYAFTKLRGAHFYQGPGRYVRDFDRADLDDSWTVGGGVGYQINQHLRTDVTLDYLGKADFSGSTSGSCGVSTNCTSRDVSSLTAWSLMANAYVDIGTYGAFTPYVGAGIGGTQVRWDKLKNTSCSTSNPDDCDDSFDHDGKRKWRFTYALMAGTSIDLTCNLQADVGYRFRPRAGWRHVRLQGQWRPGQRQGPLSARGARRPALQLQRLRGNRLCPRLPGRAAGLQISVRSLPRRASEGRPSKGGLRPFRHRRRIVLTTPRPPLGIRLAPHAGPSSFSRSIRTNVTNEGQMNKRYWRITGHCGLDQIFEKILPTDMLADQEVAALLQCLLARELDVDSLIEQLSRQRRSILPLVERQEGSMTPIYSAASGGIAFEAYVMMEADPAVPVFRSSARQQRKRCRTQIAFLSFGYHVAPKVNDKVTTCRLIRAGRDSRNGGRHAAFFPSQPRSPAPARRPRRIGWVRQRGG